jgi:hypothetical protein
MRPLAIALLIAALLAGCASFDGRGLVPGQSRASDVEALMGPPAEKLALASGESEWFYPRQPYGRQSFAVRLGADGVVRSIEQRLTAENVMKLRLGAMSARDVRALLGPPWRVSYLDRQQREVWEYTLYSADQKESFLYTQFSSDGVLREVLLLRDLAYEPGGAKD